MPHYFQWLITNWVLGLKLGFIRRTSCQKLLCLTHLSTTTPSLKRGLCRSLYNITWLLKACLSESTLYITWQALRAGSIIELERYAGCALSRTAGSLQLGFLNHLKGPTTVSVVRMNQNNKIVGQKTKTISWKRLKHSIALREPAQLNINIIIRLIVHM